MKYTVTVLAAFFVALSVAQWPCSNYGWNGPIANCASCNLLGNDWSAQSPPAYSVCTNCTAGFFLNQSACLPCTANCTKCQQNGACVAGGCAAGFAFIPTNFSCVPCPASLGCLTCQSTATTTGTISTTTGALFFCDKCPNNAYYISSTGACVACSSNCGSTLSSYSSGACSSSGCGALNCASGYGPTTTNSVTTCAACPSNCQVCQATGITTCDTCNSGYFVSSGSCSACGANCTSCTTNSNCGTCNSGFYPASGTCTACPANCASCSSSGCNLATSGTAGGCAAGYYVLANQTCTACSAANCTTCQGSGSGIATGVIGLCAACAKNTTLQNGACLPCPANCTSCVPTSSTSTSTVCLQCQLGFGLNDTTGVCVACPANCDYCDGTGVCTQCRQGTTGWSWYPTVSGINNNYQYTGANLPSTLPGGLQVTQGYFLPPNQCQQCPYNCSSCANSTFCYNNCTKNYLFNSTTNQCLPNGIERIALTGFALLSVIFYFL